MAPAQLGGGGAGGRGIFITSSATGSTIINSGTITGGFNVDGSRNAAISAAPSGLPGAITTLELQPGSTIVGNVVFAGSGNTLRLGGNGNGTFDVSTIANNVSAQYQNFATFQSNGTATWTLTGIAGGTNVPAWTVMSGTLLANGSMSGTAFTVSGGTLGGAGSVGPTTINAGGTIQPGANFVTLNVMGTFTQNANSTYAPSVNAAGQHDQINVTGNAVLNGGTVAVQASPGVYPSVQYTILTASGGVTGKYANVTSNFAFLTPTLSYDPNDVVLTLASVGGVGGAVGTFSFAGGAQSANQRAVGLGLDRTAGNASGDYANVLNALLGLSTSQGPQALDAISGQPLANFSIANIAAGNGFLNTFANQIGATHGGAGGGTHVSMLLGGDGACAVACDANAPSTIGAWVSGVGGLGSVQGDGNASTFTYSFGGTAVGADYRLSPEFLVGIGGGWVSGTQWANGFNGLSNSDTFTGDLYASFTSGPIYLDAVAGYAHANNRATRAIAIPGLPLRVAQAAAGSDQFIGLAEAGYMVSLPFSRPASVTPFARLQGTTGTEQGFTEVGANSLNLVVAPQTTSSLRTTFGADLAANLPIGGDGTVDIDLRLGWLHEYADVSRPLTASFAGAPGSAFTVFGATPQRDSAAIGFAARTHIFTSTELFARYDGEVGGGTDNHAFTAGVRMTW
jgi:uncharacterized protein with beta-barrel porin domain